jgi:hypothetical protein
MQPHSNLSKEPAGFDWRWARCRNRLDPSHHEQNYAPNIGVLALDCCSHLPDVLEIWKYPEQSSH